MRKVPLGVPFVLSLAVIALTGCKQQPTADAAQPVTEAQAKTVVTDFAKTIQSMDLTALDKWYADDVVGYDPQAPDPVEGKVSMHVANARFIDMKFDHADMPDPEIQILSPDLFVASGFSHLTSSTGKMKKADLRYTDIFKKQADGTWQLIHEHLDFPPKT